MDPQKNTDLFGWTVAQVDPDGPRAGQKWIEDKDLQKDDRKDG